jgi:hypothetical protein
MDRNERINDPVNALQQAFSGWQQKVWTALPGVLDSFNPAKMSAVVQPTVQAQLRDPAGKWNNVTLPLCLDCPVIFPGGGGYGMTFPLHSGDEGLLVFSSRCIDAWWQSGGVQPQAEFRMHDLSDGFFIPGCFSNGNVPANASTTTARFWKNDGSMMVELGDAGIVTVKAPTEIVLDTPLVRCSNLLVWAHGSLGAGGVSVAGSLHTTGDITSDQQVTGSEVTGGGIPLSNHKHISAIPGSFTNGTFPP